MALDNKTIKEAEENLKKKKKRNYLSLMPLEVTKIPHIWNMNTVSLKLNSRAQEWALRMKKITPQIISKITSIDALENKL